MLKVTADEGGDGRINDMIRLVGHTEAERSVGISPAAFRAAGFWLLMTGVHFMQFQRAQPSIVRSIRHISLVKDWARARRADPLPHFSDFVPDERSGDSADLMIAEVRPENGEPRFYCRSAGARVDQIFDRSVSDCYFLDVLDANLALAARPMWQACIMHRLPVYLIIPVNDRDGRPVTIEKIYLPYRLADQNADIVVAAMHAWSTEGRFAIQGLLDNLAAAPLHWAVVVDPSLAVAPANRADEIESN